jgi:cysteine-rich repeat protein
MKRPYQKTMRPLRRALPFVGALLSASLMQAQIAAWDFFGETAVATSTAEVYNINMDASNVMTRGAGAAASAGANSFRTVGFQNNGISTANTDYFQWTLSAASGYTLSLSTIDARFAGTAGFAAAPGVSCQFAYSLDGTTFTLIGSPTVTVGTPATLPQIDLTGIPALQGIADGTTVTFRYYASGQTGTGGWGFNSPAATQNGLAIGGSLTPLVANTSVVFNGSSATVLETVGTTPINVSITNPSPGNATTADVVLTSGSAARINSYTTQTVTFPANTSADQTVTITVTNNGINDGNATLVFQLQNVAGGQGTPSAGSPSTFTLTVTDDDAPPTVGFTSAFSSAAEANAGTTGITVSVTMDAPPAANVTVDVADALTGSATSGADYSAFGPVTFTFTSSDVYPFTQTTTLDVLGDVLLEGNETVDLSLTITSGAATAGALSFTHTIQNDDYADVVINEVDSDSPGTDAAEFVELFGPANASLNGLTVVFFNGSNDLSYASFDLDGFSLDANGFFVLGNTGVTGVDLTFAGNVLQNGADAVAVYFADATSFPNNSAVTTTNLVDAFVYDSDDADDAGLLVLLNPGQAQVNENAGLNIQGHSSARVPDGGTKRNTDTYVQQAPTPDATNLNTCDIALQPESAVCNTVTVGPGDTYTVSIPYTGIEPGITVVNNSGSGTVGGDDPAVTTNGTIIVSGISEANSYSITFTSPCNSLTRSGAAPTCEPLPAIVINEVDYDQPGTDNAEFIELKNTGSISYDLAGFVVEMRNGAGGGATQYSPPLNVTLPSFTLAPGAYYVVCATGSSVPNCNQFVTGFTLQNGVPDAIGLRDASNNLLDAVSYGGVSGAPYTETAGAPVDASLAVALTASIGRFPDGVDSNDNSVDFILSCTNSPGASNNSSVDTDGDTFLDCLDGCPLDPLKQNAGTCGCGVPDTDTDGDFVADCIDGCPADPNKIVPGACGCGNPDTDTDGDFVADCVDNCPADANPGQEDIDGDLIGDVCDVCPNGPNPGLPCNDNNPFTANDLTQNDCSCAGTPVPSTTWTLEFTTDNVGSESTWQIVDATSPFVLDAGGPYGNNTTTTENITVPTGACFNLIVTDANGMSNGTTGGWILRDSNGKRVIDNSGDGVFAGTVQPALPFCSPVGNDAIIASQCDKVDWPPGQIIIATPNAAVTAQFGVNNANSGYEFWFFNPDGGYSRRVFLTHANPGIGGPNGAIKCAHLAYSNLVTNPVPANVLLNVRVRSVVNGVYSDFGAACRFKIDQTAANCPLTQLISTPGATFSCGATGKIVKASGNVGRIYAQPATRVVNGNNQVANAYLFEITNTATGYNRLIGATSYTLVLGQWVTNPLLCGTHTYNVRVRASFDGGATYCPWGAVCSVGITNNLAAPYCTVPVVNLCGNGVTDPGETCDDGNQVNGDGCDNNCQPTGSANAHNDARVFFDGDETSTEAVLTLWPNPNNGEQLYVTIDQLNADVTTATLDIFDMVGHKVTTRTIAVNGTTLNTVIALDASMAHGMYLVNVTAGDQTFVQRLVIQ